MAIWKFTLPGVSCELVNDDCLWADTNEDDQFYNLPLNESEENKPR